jgi:hypothetical protein
LTQERAFFGRWGKTGPGWNYQTFLGLTQNGHGATAYKIASAARLSGVLVECGVIRRPDIPPAVIARADDVME